MKLRSLMIAIALVSLALASWVGLASRSRRLAALALKYGREANRQEDLWMQASPIAPGQPDLLGDEVHRNDSIANAYGAAASRPWVPFDPDPAQIRCECKVHATRPK